jgi:hypothetical protein
MIKHGDGTKERHEGLGVMLNCSSVPECCNSSEGGISDIHRLAVWTSVQRTLGT